MHPFNFLLQPPLHIFIFHIPPPPRFLIFMILHPFVRYIMLHILYNGLNPAASLTLLFKNREIQYTLIKGSVQNDFLGLLYARAKEKEGQMREYLWYLYYPSLFSSSSRFILTWIIELIYLGLSFSIGSRDTDTFSRPRVYTYIQYRE